eukprot:6730172-Lingulodinium_polyedra.AAC.1
MEEEPMVIKDSTEVLFVWHGLRLTFFEELRQVNNAIGVIDFTPGDAVPGSVDEGRQAGVGPGAEA